MIFDKISNRIFDLYYICADCRAKTEKGNEKHHKKGLLVHFQDFAFVLVLRGVWALRGTACAKRKVYLQLGMPYHTKVRYCKQIDRKRAVFN